MMQKKKRFCKDCALPSNHHINTWIDELTDRLIPNLSLPKKIDRFFDILIENFFIHLKLVSLKDDFTRSDIQLRTTCFIDEAKKRGIKFKAICGRFGYTCHMQAMVNGKIIRFDNLPTADFKSKYNPRIIDDKTLTKHHLKKRNFPIADGDTFWFWQKKKALRFGTNQLGFPLVVKPRSGSVSRHVTTDIKSGEQLKRAIDKAIIYSPTFIVEKFITNASVYRATVVDFDFVACVKQVPANVVGDGISTVRELIDKKNRDPQRGSPQQNEFTLNKITENEITAKLLSEKKHDFSTIPKTDEVVYLQKDPFLKLGGNLIEVTPEVHSDNLRLFRDIAKFFDVRVVGIDFLAQDISLSWKNQPCAIIELNNLPCIELHHFPSSGIPQNVGGAIVDLFFKYYA
ncbi:MAG: hypothetical protein ABII13_01375 [Patescibacteria group bacterium]|nr:hypothetical protein [Patescibacteria group bacterium]